MKIRRGSRGLVVAFALSLSAHAMAGPPGARAETALPNLVAAPPSDIQLVSEFPGYEPFGIAFTMAVGNSGQVPLELLSTPSSSVGFVDVRQCVSFAAERACSDASRDLGSFTFEPIPWQVGISDFAVYELRRLTLEGLPDWSPAALVWRQSRPGICLYDYDEIDQPASYAESVAHPSLYPSCTAARMGLAPGFFAVAGYHEFDQVLWIEDVPDDTYALVVSIDPNGRIAEQSNADNIAFKKVQLYDDGTRLRVIR